MTKMERIYKPSAASAIGSGRINEFKQARIKLTLFYELVVFLVLLFFSLGVYSLIDHPLGKALSGHRQIEIEIAEEGKITKAVVADEKERLKDILIAIDVVILVMTGGLSYLLAGYTLRPIELSYDRQKKFLADAAHELRTPLAVMKVGIQAARKSGAGREDYERLADESIEEINFLSRLVEDLLLLAKGDQLKRLALKPINLTEIIEKQVLLMRPYAEKHSVTLTATDGKPSLMILGDETLIKQLLTNLLKNAIDYNVPNGSVSVTAQTERNLIRVAVSDTGVGIAAEHLQKIFDRFYKVDEAREQRSGGAGLGLSIVREIVKMHHGHIDAESTKGVGTSISVFLPAILEHPRS